MFCFILHPTNKNSNDTIDIIFKGEKFSCLKDVVLSNSPKIKSLIQDSTEKTVELNFEPKTEMNYFEDLYHIFNLRQIFVNINNIDFLEEISEYLEFSKLYKYCGKFRQQFSAVLENPIFLKLEELEEAIFSFKKVTIKTEKFCIEKEEKVPNQNDKNDDMKMQIKNENSDDTKVQIKKETSNIQLANDLNETESTTTSQLYQFHSSDIISTDSSLILNVHDTKEKINNVEEEEENEEENSDFKKFLKIGIDHSYDSNIGNLIYEACKERPYMCYTYMSFIYYLNQRNYDVTNIISKIFKKSMENTNRIDIFIFRYLYEMNLLQYSQIPLRAKCSYYFSDKKIDGHSNYSYDKEVCDYFIQIEKQQKNKEEEEKIDESDKNKDTKSVINYLFNECGDWFRPFYENKMKEGTNQTEIAIAIRNDDLDELQKIYAIQNTLNNDFVNSFVQSDIFECYETFPYRISYLDYSALYGATKCFKFLFLNGGKINESTFSNAIHGGNYEIIHIVYNYLTDEKKYSKEVIANSLKKALEQTICCHSSELLQWLYEQNFVFFSLKNTCCTFALFKNQLIDQQFYQCEKCIKEGICGKKEGFCHFCSRNCHRNHSSHFSVNSIKCFCDCGSKQCKGCQINHLISFDNENDENNNNDDQIFNLDNNQNENNNQNNVNNANKSTYKKEIAIIDEFVSKAIAKCNYKGLRFLIEHGVDFKNLSFGVLTYTAKCNDLKLFEVLLKIKRIEISKDKDVNMKTPIYYAHQNNNDELSQLIHDVYFSLKDL